MRCEVSTGMEVLLPVHIPLVAVVAVVDAAVVAVVVAAAAVVAGVRPRPA
jgi:hypothetical protein